jgi:hypothetical protein
MLQYHFHRVMSVMASPRSHRVIATGPVALRGVCVLLPLRWIDFILRVVMMDWITGFYSVHMLS